MKTKIVYSKAAVADLKEIRDYIQDELLNPTAASNTVTGILNKVERLSDFPESGQALYFDDLNSGYRYVRYKNYLAFYHLLDAGVFVDRVLYEKRNYRNILQD